MHFSGMGSTGKGPRNMLCPMLSYFIMCKCKCKCNDVAGEIHCYAMPYVIMCKCNGRAGILCFMNLDYYPNIDFIF